MKRKFFLFSIPAIIIFLGISYANMHSTNSNKSDSSTPDSQDTVNKAALPESVHRGKLLYENHCRTCHNKYLHNRSNSKIKSIRDLRQWVIRWSLNLKLDWKKNDIDSVTEYLNNHFYHF